MVTHIHADIFTTHCEYIAHQTNCIGVAGAGLALAIRNRIPNWYSHYKKHCAFNHYNTLGTIHIYKNIISVFGQANIGRTKRQTNYCALTNAFKQMCNYLPKHTSIALPYNFGCGLAGGDWNIVYNLIETILSPHFNIFIYKK